MKQQEMNMKELFENRMKINDQMIRQQLQMLIR